ncbi:MAG: HAMP domain-containing histidine kinase, partial [Deltaproteobacteria bacterium]|nr:HAMP domain-containing histidine kinase [Deltaproteobacteria bacterium]
MNDKPDNKTGDEITGVLSEIKGNPYHNLNVAFALMGVIPLLASFYLIASKLFRLNIVIGEVGAILFNSTIISLCGVYISYSIVKGILKKLIFYATKNENENKLKSELVATVSHQFRNPLAVLLGNIELLAMGQKGEENREQLEMCNRSLEIISRMTRLTNNLLDIYKIEAGMVKLDKKPCDLENILAEQIDEFGSMIEKKNIRWNKEMSGGEQSVIVDRTLITEVINNLLSNAIKYTPEHGVITVRTGATDKIVRMEVEDNGPGIPEDKLGKVFDKFEQLGSPEEGKGLGLAIAKDIVELHR